MHALTWLEEFLKSWERTVVIVSHDRTFLNSVTTQTVFLHRRRLWYYGAQRRTPPAPRGGAASLAREGSACVSGRLEPRFSAKRDGRIEEIDTERPFSLSCGRW